MADNLKVPGGGQAYPDSPPCYDYTKPPKVGYGYGYPQGYWMNPNQQPPGGVIKTQQLPGPPQVRQSEHMVESILSCLCCFWPVGLAAIVMSCLSAEAYDSGDYTRGQMHGRTAGMLALTSFVLGVIIIIVILSLWFTVLAQ